MCKEALSYAPASLGLFMGALPLLSSGLGCLPEENNGQNIFFKRLFKVNFWVSGILGGSFDYQKLSSEFEWLYISTQIWD